MYLFHPVPDAELDTLDGGILPYPHEIGNLDGVLGALRKLLSFAAST